MKKTNFIAIILLCIFSISFLITQNINVYASTDEYSAKAYFLMDYNTNEILLEKNSEDKIPVASIVKLMTIDLTCEELEKGNLSIDQIVVASENAASMGGSQVFIEANGEYKIGDLLKSTIVSSANDASVLLAETIAGSESNFVSLMNKKANELGLKNTNYVNCTGLPASGQFSCAKDTAILLKEVTKHNDYHRYSTIWMDTLKHPNGRESELVNTNKLIRYFEGCDGGKTGSTSEAGYCLSATAKRGNMRLIGVILGAENGKSRFSETAQLLNYGFANFENKLIVDSLKPLNDKVDISNGKEDSVEIRAEKDLYVLTKKRDESNNISTLIKTDENLKAPIKIGDKIGTIYVLKNGEVISECNLISTENIEKVSMIDYLNRFINLWNLA